jgi:hypothetical protein
VRPVFKISLATAALLTGLILTAIGVRAMLVPLVSAAFGIDIVKSSLFYFAVVALSLIFYLVLLVFAVLTWERFQESSLGQKKSGHAQ